LLGCALQTRSNGFESPSLDHAFHRAWSNISANRVQDPKVLALINLDPFLSPFTQELSNLRTGAFPLHGNGRTVDAAIHLEFGFGNVPDAVALPSAKSTSAALGSPVAPQRTALVAWDYCGTPGTVPGADIFPSKK